MKLKTMLYTEKEIKLRNMQKMSLKKKIVIGIITIVSILILGWSVFLSLLCGFIVYPHQAISLFNAQKYYEKHIVSYYLKYGKEYKLKNVDTSDWNTFISDEYGFEFKYPKDYEIVIRCEAGYMDSCNFFVEAIDRKNNFCYKKISINESNLGRINGISLPFPHSAIYYRSIFEEELRGEGHSGEKLDLSKVKYSFTDSGLFFRPYVENSSIRGGGSLLNYDHKYDVYFGIDGRYYENTYERIPDVCPDDFMNGILKTFKFIEK